MQTKTAKQNKARAQLINDRLSMIESKRLMLTHLYTDFESCLARKEAEIRRMNAILGYRADDFEVKQGVAA